MYVGGKQIEQENYNNEKAAESMYVGGREQIEEENGKKGKEEEERRQMELE